jgi:galactose mutarotase-like enzyme
MMETISSSIVDIVIDPDYGGEICSISPRHANLNLLMQTPWARQARHQRQAGLTYPVSASETSWMARYAGGWQVLFPHAGTSETTGGGERHYHGEASVTRWQKEESSPSQLCLSATLLTVPVALRRSFHLHGSTFTVVDTAINGSEQDVLFDFVHHPAFGAPFLDKHCIIETGARTYVPDPRGSLGEFEPGLPIPWPRGRAVDGSIVSLDSVPAPSSTKTRFGWLQDFSQQWIAVRNPRLDIGVRLSWKSPEMNYAWFWLEAGANLAAPWFGRGYALALEPASTPTAGEKRCPLRLAPREKKEFRMRLDLLPGRSPISALMDED